MSSHRQQKKPIRTMPQQVDSQHKDICPTCGHLVPAQITRHKSLGIYVPVWRRGTCKNPDCGTSGGEPAR
ncbi:hypothetical protein [Streptomyces sp. enrichment culture]|uniref:hypothetical protein n=1 Tax=Streptomyces sp. enrichment culture TaxID=1795815 RepID=UPI003F54E509